MGLYTHLCRFRDANVAADRTNLLAVMADHPLVVMTRMTRLSTADEMTATVGTQRGNLSHMTRLYA